MPTVLAPWHNLNPELLWHWEKWFSFSLKWVTCNLCEVPWLLVASAPPVPVTVLENQKLKTEAKLKYRSKAELKKKSWTLNHAESPRESFSLRPLHDATFPSCSSSQQKWKPNYIFIILSHLMHCAELWSGKWVLFSYKAGREIADNITVHGLLSSPVLWSLFFS